MTEINTGAGREGVLTVLCIGEIGRRIRSHILKGCYRVHPRTQVQDRQSEGPLERFGEILLGKLVESLRHDTRQIQMSVPVLVGHSVRREQIQPERRAVGIDEAAELVGLSKWTIRKYVAERRIFSVRAGRWILIRIETVDKKSAWKHSSAIFRTKSDLYTLFTKHGYANRIGHVH
jgi:excisionase family DNA binding protein